jgi:hypothetical protein
MNWGGEDANIETKAQVSLSYFTSEDALTPRNEQGHWEDGKREIQTPWKVPPSLREPTIGFRDP